MTANGIKNDDTLGVVPQTIVPKTAQHDVIPAKVSYYEHGEAYYNDNNPGPPTNVAQGVDELVIDLDADDYPGKLVFDEGQEILVKNCGTTTIIGGPNNVEKDAVVNFINRDAGFNIETINDSPGARTLKLDIEFVQADDYPQKDHGLVKEPCQLLLPCLHATQTSTIQPGSREIDDRSVEPLYQKMATTTEIVRNIDPMQLFSGQLRVTLKGDDDKPFENLYGTDRLRDPFGAYKHYTATIVFIHKKSK